MDYLDPDTAMPDRGSICARRTLRHSGLPHAHTRLATSCSKVFRWWLGRGVSPWDEEADAMVRRAEEKRKEREVAED